MQGGGSRIIPACAGPVGLRGRVVLPTVPFADGACRKAVCGLRIGWPLPAEL